MYDNTRSGDDTLIGGGIGDAYEMHDNARGGNDTLIGGAGGTNNSCGDAYEMYDNAQGGHDTLIGGDNASNDLYGDAYYMSDNAHGGNDILIDGASAFNVLFGDANLMYGNARGGNDTLTGSLLYGDAGFLHDNAVGGNDTLTGGSTSADNTLYGDALAMLDNAHGGNDALISGTGTDHMWGDAQIINGVQASPAAPTGTVVTGADTFIFAPGNGNDDINDFRQSDHDKIDVSAYGFHSIADMTITADRGGNTRIAFDANDSVTLVGISDPHSLHASDFIFGGQQHWLL